VSERLPEDGQSVIVCFEGGGMAGQVGEATFDKRGGWFSTEQLTVQAWQPMHLRISTSMPKRLPSMPGRRKG
jgi:hypothetical protein